MHWTDTGNFFVAFSNVGGGELATSNDIINKYNQEDEEG